MTLRKVLETASVLCLFVSSIVAQEITEYDLVWADEFRIDGPIDTSKWCFEEGFKRNYEEQWYQQENAYCRNGLLYIEGRQVKRPNPTFQRGSKHWRTQREMIEYTSSSIHTRDKFDFKYGRMEVRAKVTNEEGTWPAIWMLGVECEWPSNGEVDIMENYEDAILANFAWGTEKRWTAHWNSVKKPVVEFGEGWLKEFHIWRLDWDENTMKIYIDDVLINEQDLKKSINGSYSCDKKNPFKQPHYILLNLALGGDRGGDVKQTTFPTYYIVDYVRVYQTK